MLRLIAFLVAICYSLETGPSTTPEAQLITETTTTEAPKPEECSNVMLNTYCSANITGSTCDVGCLDGQNSATYACDETTLEWMAKTMGEECPIDVIQWNMHDLYCKDRILELEPEMSAYQCADKVASNPDCLTDVFTYAPFTTCSCVKNVEGCHMEYSTAETAVGVPAYVTINATDMYVPLATDLTCGEKQDAVHFCKECEWEEIMSIEECAGMVLESLVCSPIFSWLDERNPEENQCWCVPIEKNSCHFEKAHDHITYTLTQHRDLTGDPPVSELKKFTLTMIVVTMVVTPVLICFGFCLHLQSAKGKDDDFGDVLLDDQKYNP